MLRPILRKEAIFRLLPHIVVREEAPVDSVREQLMEGFRICERLCCMARVYTLSYPIEDQSLDKFLYEFVTKSKNLPKP